MESLFQAQQLNKDIFETIYYHALKASAELAAKEGPYETYKGSPVSKVFFYNFSLIKSYKYCLMFVV
jgi:ribonucleotide reductase alpha subunit